MFAVMGCLTHEQVIRREHLQSHFTYVTHALRYNNSYRMIKQHGLKGLVLFISTATEDAKKDFEFSCVFMTATKPPRLPEVAYLESSPSMAILIDMVTLNNIPALQHIFSMICLVFS
jgi:hypothetical protein